MRDITRYVYGSLQLVTTNLDIFVFHRGVVGPKCAKIGTFPWWRGLCILVVHTFMINRNIKNIGLHTLSLLLLACLSYPHLHFHSHNHTYILTHTRIHIISYTSTYTNTHYLLNFHLYKHT